jgi:hypothetical protein
MTTQFGAVSGRRRRPNYTGIINAQSPNLPQWMRLGKEAKFADERLALDREGLRLTKEATQEQQDKENLALMLGVGQTALQGYMGYKENKAVDEIISNIPVKGATTKPAVAPFDWSRVQDPSQIPKKTIASEVVNAPTIGTETTPSFFSKEGLLNKEAWGEALTSGATWGGGLTGTMASSLFGGDDSTKNALIGAGVGGLTSWAMSGGLQTLLKGGGLGGGDMYSSVIGAGMGWLGSLFL